MVLAEMPAKKIRQGLRGIVDFYEWMGMVIARKWPRYNPRMKEAGKKGQERFQFCVEKYNQLSEEERLEYRKKAKGGGLSGRDVFFSLCLTRKIFP